MAGAGDSTGAALIYNAAWSSWQRQGAIVDTYCLISQNGGHPGASLDAVRRWTAPVSGTIRITGNAHHDAEAIYGESVVIIRKGGTVERKRVVACSSWKEFVTFAW